MTFQPHLQIFNSSRVTHEQDLAFPLFPRLTAEIRLKIWEHSLQRQRIIRVKLKSRAEDPVTQPAESTESASKSERYHALVDGHQGISKLLRVNNQTRSSAFLPNPSSLHARNRNDR